MAQLSPVLKTWFLVSDTVCATSLPGDILDGWSIKRVGDAPAHVTIPLNMLSAISIAIINATGGPSLTGPIQPLRWKFSLDGGATWDMAGVLVSAHRSMDPTRPVLTIDQDDLSALYNVTGVDRVTYIDVSPADVLDGAPNTIPRPKGSIGNNATWPYVKGLDKVTVGLGAWKGQPQLNMTMVADTSLSGIPLSVDIYADMINNALKTIATRLAGAWNPTDMAPFGARGHWVSLSGDGVRNSLGIAQAIAIGRVGKTPVVTFDGDTPGPWDETTTCHFASTGMGVEPMLAELYAQASFIGGISNHGIDNGQASSGGPATKVLCGVVINTGRGAASTRWDDNLPIVGTSSGVYYDPHTGFLVAMSQAMVVNAIAYDASKQILYAFTPHGVYTAIANPPPYKVDPKTGLVQAPPWTLVGGLSAPCEDGWLDGSTVLARCGGSTKKNGAGIDGIYQYPALAGDTSGNTQGYAGWSRIAHSGAPLAAGGTAAKLYYTDRNKPGVAYLVQPGTSTAPVAITGIAAGQQVIGIDTGRNLDGSSNGYVYLRTDAGASGIYAVAIGSTSALYAGSGIVSNDGAVVQVRQIRAYGAGLQGEYVALLAATDAGLFRCGGAAGNGWTAPDATSGLGDFDIAWVMAGSQQTILGRATTRLFAGAERSYLTSHNAGDNWTELLADKLDCGPFWFALALLSNGGAWPDNSIGALGTLSSGSSGSGGSVGVIAPSGGTVSNPAPPPGGTSPAGSTDTGGTGTVLAIDTSSDLGKRHQLPAGWLWARRLDEQCRFTFRLVNLNSVAPLAGMQFHELSELQANANIGPITASEQVALVTWRWLSGASVPRFEITINSTCTQSNAKLRDLAFGDMARLQYNPAGWTAVLAVNMNLYCTSHTITGTAWGAVTSTTLSNTLEKGTLDANAMAAAQADHLAKHIRFGAA